MKTGSPNERPRTEMQQLDFIKNWTVINDDEPIAGDVVRASYEIVKGNL